MGRRKTLLTYLMALTTDSPTSAAKQFLSWIAISTFEDRIAQTTPKSIASQNSFIMRLRLYSMAKSY